MTQRPWIVALISTDYDLKDERKVVIQFLQNYGMEASAFEEPDFPVQENAHSHETCLKALGRADLAILLINERYGGRLYSNQDISITQEEYEALNVPTIVLVKKSTWDERASYRRQLKQSGLSEEQFACSGMYDAGRIDINVFRFIDKIQNAYYSSGRSNWINFWEDYEDLKKKLPDLLRSRGISLIHEILKGQIKEVKNRRTSTGLSMPLGDVFDRGYYIEPEFDCKSGAVDASDSLTQGILKKLKEKDSCLILGEAGVGKTTLIANCFLSIAEEMKGDSFVFPVYVWLKGKNLDSSFTVEEYLQEGCEQFFQKKVYPFFNVNDCHFIFFLDGIDEFVEKLSKDGIQRFLSSEIFKWPLMMTSRKHYAERYLNSNDFTSKFGSVIELKDWTLETAKRYISQFCFLQNKDKAFEDRIMALLVENEDLYKVLNSPLLITILLYIIEHNRMEIPETIRSRTQLFEECLNLLADREIENRFKEKGKTIENQTLVLQWAFFAWIIYERRLNGEKDVRISDAISTIEKVFPHAIIGCPETAYEVIFDIDGGNVFGTIHEQFLEYLVAKTLAFACLLKTEPYPAFLKYVVRPEINRYFRGIVSSKSCGEQKQIFDHIKELYWGCAGDNTYDSVLKRVHAVYHLSRLPSENADTEIDRIFNTESERTVLQSLYFGVIKKGDLKREKILYELLNSDDDYSTSNRGYHLAYYGSALSDSSLIYQDDMSVDWGGPLQAFLRHFSSHDLEHYYLRRIDLVTMRQFMEYRGKREPVNDTVLAQLESFLGKVPHGAKQEYQQLVVDEFQKFKEAYERLV